MTSGLPVAELANITFRIADDTYIVNNSCTVITDREATNGTVAVRGGVCDLHMGTFDHTVACKTCEQIAPYCPGHPGHINANYPQISPLFIAYAIKWLQVLCHNCSAPITVPGDTTVYRSLKDWHAAIRAYVSSRELKCSACPWVYAPVELYRNSTVLIVYGKPAAGRGAHMRERHTASKHEMILWPHKILTIFARVPDSLVAQVGLEPYSHPRRVVWTKFPVSPNNLRPELRKHNGEVTSRNDLTTYLINLVDCNSKIPRDKSYDDIIADAEGRELVIKLGELLFSMIVTQVNTGMKINGSDKPMISIMERQKGKFGRIRGNLLGRRSTNSARSFITCNTMLRYDEVGIPMKVATSQNREEVVSQYNFKRCLAYYMSNEYPRARKIIRGTRTYEVEKLRASSYVLAIGDVILRDIIDGDYVVLNRQPSLEPSSLCALHARVIVGIDTFQMNVEICYFFNADFDGDAMNAYFPRNARSAYEVGMLASPEQFFIAQKNGLNKLGESQDALVGLSGLSATATRFTFHNAAQLFADVPLVPALARAPASGRELMSAAFVARGYLINYEGKPEICSGDYEGFRTYDPADRKVIVKNGVFESGVIDKASVGKDRSGGILHQIYDMRGATAALRAGELMQRMAMRYLYHQGLTISIDDLLILPRGVENIRRIEAGILADSYALAARLDAGEIVAPVGQTTGVYYETLQLNALRHGSKFMADVLTSINFEENGFCRMIATGARGKFSNFLSVGVSIGQTVINGERHPETFNDRCLPFYTRYDRDPTARGYICASYLQGLNNQEWFAHSVEARLQLISKSLSTSVVGAMNRHAIKSYENHIVDNLRRLANAGNIIQPLYGGDGCDPKCLKFASVPTCAKTLDAEAFLRDWKYTPPAGSPAGLKALATEEFDALTADRAAFIAIAVRAVASNVQITYSHKVALPVDVAKIIHNVQAAEALTPSRSTGASSGGRFDAGRAMEMVRKLIWRMPYVLYNRAWRRAKRPVSPIAATSMTYMNMHLRAWLCVRNLQRLNVTMSQLRAICREVYEKYSQSLIDYGKGMGIIAAQSISEPMTQMVLDSAHRVGAQGGGGGMARVKEILTSMPTHHMNKLGKYIGTTPSMVVYLLDKYAGDPVRVQEFASQMEMLTLRHFTKNRQVFVEDYGKPTHPDFVHEVEMFRQFEKYNDAAKHVPGNLARYCIRIECNKSEMFQKQMHHGNEIVDRLRTLYKGQLWIVYTADDEDTYVLRIYLQQSITTHLTSDYVYDLSNAILDVTVRGVPGIFSTSVQKRSMPVQSVGADGVAILTEREINYIITEGTNIAGVAMLPFVNPNMIISNAIIEMEEMYGVTVARNRIVGELQQQIEGISYRHYTVYASELTYTGTFTSMDRHGSVKRNKSFMQHISEARAKIILVDTAIKAATDTLDNVSSSIMMGKTPKLGNRYNDFIMDTDFMAERIGDVSALIATL